MDVLIAILHILGSIIVITAFSFFVMYIGSLEAEKNQKHATDEVSVTLGLRVEDLEKDEHVARVLELTSKKFSSDLFINRLSDLCGSIRTLWGWLSIIVQLGIFVAVCWYTITEGTESAIYAWALVGLSIFFWLSSVVFSLLCKLFTGRYPGQAKEARKLAALWVKQNGDRLLKQ